MSCLARWFGLWPAMLVILVFAPTGSVAQKTHDSDFGQLQTIPLDTEATQIPIASVAELGKLFAELDGQSIEKVRWEQFIRLRVVGKLEQLEIRIPATTPGVLGDFAVDAELSSLQFSPKYGLAPGVLYGIYRRDGDGFQILATATVSTEDQIAPKLLGVHPAAEVLPENLLKFYLEFSRPMQRGRALEMVSLQTEAGRRIDRCFLALEQELWSRDGKRLTLILDPGRVKRGLRPRAELGPILEQGKSYQLHVDARWKDDLGRELAKSTTFRFVAGEYDETCPQPVEWQLEPGRAGTRDALTVKFDEPLDYAMLARVITVERLVSTSDNPASENPGNQVVDGSELTASEPQLVAIEGEVSVGGNQQIWKFVPAANWIAGEYLLQFPDNLEDLAGNSIGQQFEVDRFDRTRPTAPARLKIEFKIR